MSAFSIVVFQLASAQEKKTPEIRAVFKKGLNFSTADSSFSLGLRFRVQSRVGYASVSERNFSPKEFEFRIRRIRLRLDGNLFSPRLTYNIQFSFSRADMDWDVSGFPNVLRDAMISYKFRNGLVLAMGQGKLPGNRQRVISSGELQFADRSIVSNALTLDRDFGLFLSYFCDGRFAFRIKTAVSSGEGRNVLKTDKGLAYTARVELLPLGTFSDGGDYFEGDLLREPKPKLAIAGGGSFNNGAMRTGGQLGRELYEGRDLYGAEADVMFKYSGFALSVEYLYRYCKNPITYNKDSLQRTVYAGQGVNAQASYCFKKMWEIGTRYSLLVPQKEVEFFEKNQQQFSLVLSKYLIKHKVKVQTDFTYELNRVPSNLSSQSGNFQCRFQIELGI